MINVKELEKRWLKYKTKSFMILLFMVTIIGSLIYGGYYILYKLDFGKKREHKKAVLSAVKVADDKNISIATTATPTATPTPTPTPIATATNQPIEKSTKDIIQLAPNIPLVDIDNREIKIKKKESKHIVQHKKKRLVKRIKRYRPKIKAKLKPKEHIKPKKVAVHKKKIEHKRKKIDFKVTTNNYMTIMKEKFNKNRNPRDALLIAKAYYRAGNYKESEIWALKANSLNKNSEESWLLFAKSKDALGEREEALKILIAYYNKTKSPNAKLLIEKISSKSI